MRSTIEPYPLLRKMGKHPALTSTMSGLAYENSCRYIDTVHVCPYNDSSLIIHSRLRALYSSTLLFIDEDTFFLAACYYPGFPLSLTYLILKRRDLCPSGDFVTCCLGVLSSSTLIYDNWVLLILGAIPPLLIFSCNLCSTVKACYFLRSFFAHRALLSI